MIGFQGIRAVKIWDKHGSTRTKAVGRLKKMENKRTNAKTYCFGSDIKRWDKMLYVNNYDLLNNIK